MRRPSPTFVLLSALLLGAVGLLLLQRTEHPPLAVCPPPGALTTAATSTDRADIAGEPEARPARAASYPEAVLQWRTLQGTDMDGELARDARGHLVLGPEVRRLFEYFLSAEGEASDEEISSRIIAEIRARLEDPAAREAEELLGVYLAYRESARSMPLPEDRGDGEAALDALSKLRQEYFGEERARALFGDEEREARTALAESRARADDGLGAEALEAEVEAEEASLADPVRAARAESQQPSESLFEEERLREEGATEEEIEAERVALFGPEAAERLRALDRRQAEWEERVSALRATLARLAELIPDGSDRGEAERALIEASFSPPERLRVRALLHLDDPTR